MPTRAAWTLAPASAVIGREDKAKEIVRFLAGGKGYCPPFISVYGRSGSGKSTVLRFVCESLKNSGHIAGYAFVNLRMARTVFGCASMILEEFKSPSRGAEMARAGVDGVLEQIREELGSLSAGNGAPFVLVLDEFDSIFSDTRGRPSDFVYRLLQMQERLRHKGSLTTIVAISNNMVADYDVDDRVRSRMGSAEVSFGAYSKDDVLRVLEQKAEKAIVNNGCKREVLEYCAQVCSEEHGDARRAIELLRAAGELAGLTQQPLQKEHVDMAAEKLQKERVAAAPAGASYHLKIACAAMVRISYLTGEEEEWYATSTIYNQYCMTIRKEVKPLTYRRVSELLGELVNAGLAVSATQSRGRHLGYGTRYRLTVSPELIGSTCFPDWWKGIAEMKRRHEKELQESRQRRFETAMGQALQDPYYSVPRILTLRSLEEQEKTRWKEFVGET